MVLTRTAKSCGSDAPIVGVKSAIRSAGDGVKKRGHRGEREVSRKTIARSNATKQSILPLRGEMDCFAEPVIGRAFARPVGSFAMSVNLLRRGTDRRTAGWPMQVGDRYKCAHPRTKSREGDVDPVFGI